MTVFVNTGVLLYISSLILTNLTICQKNIIKIAMYEPCKTHYILCEDEVTFYGIILNQAVENGVPQHFTGKTSVSPIENMVILKNL